MTKISSLSSENVCKSKLLRGEEVLPVKRLFEKEARIKRFEN